MAAGSTEARATAEAVANGPLPAPPAILGLIGMVNPRFPSLYQINTRVWLNGGTLDDAPDAELDHIAARGFEWVWLLGVWQTGEKGREAALAEPPLMDDYRRALPDFTERDVCGSCFSVAGYTVARSLGGDAALARIRERLQKRGLRLMVDLVPNHTALDHPWVRDHPEFYVHGTEADLARDPRNYYRTGSAVLAHGRDPYFPGWQDTLQLNYAEPAMQEAMISEMLRIAGQADGVRCDMAMLILPDVFEKTWGLRPPPFWPHAIDRVRAQHPQFTFLAEVYWDREWDLQQQGFDYTYDKRLYDRLRDGHAPPVREHFLADAAFQRKSARFLENHDEPRAAATFPPAMHRAAAVLAFLCPGLRFFHQGQLEGRRVRLPVQLCREPAEPLDQDLAGFYDRLLACLRDDVLRDGEWELVEPLPAWNGNGTSDSFLGFAWSGPGGRRMLIAVNYSASQGQCYLRPPFPDLRGKQVRFEDRLGPDAYDRDGDEVLGRGLYLDLPAWGCHVFDVRL